MRLIQEKRKEEKLLGFFPESRFFSNRGSKTRVGAWFRGLGSRGTLRR